MIKRLTQARSANSGTTYKEIVDDYKQQVPQGEHQTPEDIAHAVLFLASHEAKHITGTQLTVDGGLTMSGRDVMDIMTAREKYVTGVNIWLDQSRLDDSFIDRFRDILTPYQNGTCPLNIYYRSQNAEAKLTLGVQWRVSPVDELLHELKPLVDSVELKFG